MKKKIITSLFIIQTLFCSAFSCEILCDTNPFSIDFKYKINPRSTLSPIVSFRSNNLASVSKNLNQTDTSRHFKIKNNNFTFEIGGIYIVPKYNEFRLLRDTKFPDDVSYDMKVKPQNSYGININFGYLVNLKSINNLKIKLPIKIGYTNFILENNQYGVYSGGIAGNFFLGKIISKTTYNILNLITGIDIIHLNDKYDELDFNINFGLNLATKTYFDITEIPDDLILYKVQTRKGSFKDFSLIPSLNLKVARLFKMQNLLIGPFISINDYLLFNKQTPSIYYSINNTAFYYFLETGLKLKF
jgi:hypothetical protein